MQKKPIFQSIFGESWHNLPSVMHKHYANRPFTKDQVIIEGEMDVKFKGIFKIISLILKLTSILAPIQGQNIPVRVIFKSDENDNSFHLLRHFNYLSEKAYWFNSKIVEQEDGSTIEWLNLGLSSEPINLAHYAPIDFHYERIRMLWNYL